MDCAWAIQEMSLATLRCLSSSIRALQFADTCSVNKGILFLDTTAGPFAAEIQPSPPASRTGSEGAGAPMLAGIPWSAAHTRQRGLGMVGGLADR